MASFAIEDFVGNGCLQGLVSKLLEEGWDDVPTLKIMNVDDMNELNMTQPQKDALEIRSYLHDRALMQYADKLEGSAKSLTELLNLSTVDLTSKFGMKRGHVARFTDRTAASGGDSFSETYNLHMRRRTTSGNESHYRKDISPVTSRKQSMTRSLIRTTTDISLEQSMADLGIKDGYVFKGIVASMPDEPRACGCVQATPVVETVAPYSSIENISVQKLTPQYKIGMERLVTTKTAPMRASKLWRDKPAVFVCIRRPGRAKSMGVDQNFRGEGEIKGGLFIVGKGKSGIAYQFIERNFGDWAPLAEVIEVCRRLQIHEKGS